MLFASLPVTACHVTYIIIINNVIINISFYFSFSVGGPVRKVVNQPGDGIFRTTQEVEVIEGVIQEKLTPKVKTDKPKSPTKPPKHVKEPGLYQYNPSKGKTNLTQPDYINHREPPIKVEPGQTKKNLTGKSASDPVNPAITRKCAMLIMCHHERVGS